VLPIELHPLDRWLGAIHAARPDAPWPRAEDAATRAAAITRQGLLATGARCCIVCIPARATPDELLAFLKERVLDDPPTSGRAESR
jgi:hypothetical protein